MYVSVRTIRSPASFGWVRRKYSIPPSARACRQRSAASGTSLKGSGSFRIFARWTTWPSDYPWDHAGARSKNVETAQQRYEGLLDAALTEGPPERAARFVELTLGVQQHGEIVERVADLGMLRRE